MAHNGPQGECVGRQTAHIQTFLTCIYRGRLSDGLGHVFYIVFAESNYIGTADKSRDTATYHQHYDIPESVTVVSLACSAEIRH